tara:strand:- start:118 stop:561 length:444 start_codon:yes stop_codon:yes gene_type:complete
MSKIRVIKENKKLEEVDEVRLDVIGQNGNTGLHYDELNDAISFITKKYPETTKMFQNIQFEQWELFCKKQKDYGPKNISVGTNLETEEEVKLALTGLWFRMNDKMQRFQQMVINNQEPENESLMDTFMDLANYAIIAQLVQEKVWGK